MRSHVKPAARPRGGRSQAVPERRVGAEPDERRRQRARVAGRHEQRGVAERLAQRRQVRARRGDAAQGRLERRQAEALHERGVHEREGPGVERVELRVGDGARQADPGDVAQDPFQATGADHDEVGVEAARDGAPVGLGEHRGRLAGLERAHREEVRPGGRRRRAAGPDPGRRARQARPGVDDVQAGGVERPGRGHVVAHGRRDRRHGGGPRGRRPRAREAVEQALVARVVGGAVLPGAVMDGQDDGDAGRHRDGRRGRHPHDVGAAGQAVQPGTAGERGGPEDRLRGQGVRTSRTPAGAPASGARPGTHARRARRRAPRRRARPGRSARSGRRPAPWSATARRPRPACGRGPYPRRVPRGRTRGRGLAGAGTGRAAARTSVGFADSAGGCRQGARVALVHDFLLDLRGAERVFLALCDIFPQADVFTAVYDEEGTEGRFAHRNVKPSFLQALHPTARTFRALLPLYPAAMESLDLRGYDLVVSSSSAWAHGVIPDEDAVHVCYCHNPFRYAWNARDETLAAPRPGDAARRCG